MVELQKKKDSVHEPEPEEEFQQLHPADDASRLTINNLSEALSRSSKTIENLVRIVAEYYIGKKD